MRTNIAPFLDRGGAIEDPNTNLLVELGRETSRRRLDPAQPDPDEELGLDRLGTLLDTIRLRNRQSWRQFALSASPRPFNPVFLMLMSLRLIRRREITDEVFLALGNLMQVRVDTLRSMFRVEEVEQPEGIFAGLRLPKIRISDLLSALAVPAPSPAILGDSGRQPASSTLQLGESDFEEAGFRVKCTHTEYAGLFVEINATPGGGSRVPSGLTATVVSNVDGSIKAGPVPFERGGAHCGPVDWDPLDRLVIEG